MPSYYDSTKKKPGKAKLKYNKGGKVKKMSDGQTVTAEDRRRDAQIKKDLAQYFKDNPPKRMSEADRAARDAREQAAWDAEYDKAKRVEKLGDYPKGQGVKKLKDYPTNRKVKKMFRGGTATVVGVENGHDVTLARGSGAARPQKFRKNG